MKVPYSWLADLTDLSGITMREYQNALTMSGSKVEGIEYLGEQIQNVVTCKIISIEKHPDADKLSVCMVNIGEGKEPVQIVTAAKNMQVDDIVPLAQDKSTLASGMKITKGKLRGVMSFGMFCSHEELGLTLGNVPYGCEDGLLIMPSDTPVGVDIRTVLGLDEHVVEFEITSNRPDCLAVLGLARETAATFNREFKHTPLSIVDGAVSGEVNDFISVEVKDTELCARYAARVVKDVKIEPSPAWMRERLHACGVRPINNIVDITNYVMLEYGQPMHAFDYACLSDKKIIVRRAENGEIMKTLDDEDRALTSDMLVIADGTKPVAVAGVMGGLGSGITESTKTVVFESANFAGGSVRITAKNLGMRTESSGRFEKGLDPVNAMYALERACNLIEELGAGTVVSGTIDEAFYDKTPVKLPLEVDKINALLGTSISKADMQKYLTILDFGVEGDDVIVPSFRADVRSMSDLAEEVARIFGYDNIPTTLYAGETVQGALTTMQAFENKATSACRSFGFDEIITHSFISPKMYDKIAYTPSDIRRLSTTITNPLGEDFSVMRTTTLGCMLDILSRNQSFRNADVKLYELGMIYTPVVENGKVIAEKQPKEEKVLTLGAYGKIDFFEFKGYVETILSTLSVFEVSFEADKENSSYHPGRTAKIFSGDILIGTMGTIHPAVCKNFELSSDVLCAELNMNSLLSASKPERQYKHLPKFPASTRDLAILCADEIPVAKLENCIKNAVGKTLESVKLFDVYRGNQIEEGKKSVAYAIVLRAEDRTLTVEECDKAVAKALSALQNEFDAVLRG